MATVLDEFVLKFSLDPSTFTEGQRKFMESVRSSKEDIKKFGGEIESQEKKIFEVFGELKRAALGVAGLLIGGMGIKEFTSFITNMDAATARTARTMNISARELSNWQGAARQLGGTAQGITSVLSTLSNEMATFQLTGQWNPLGPLTQLGIGPAKTITELMLKVADKLSTLNPATAKAFAAQLGAGDQDTVNLLINGRRALEELLEASDRAGHVTIESAEATKEYQRQLSLLEQNAEDVGRTLFVTLSPALIGVTSETRSFLELIRALLGAFGKSDWAEFGKNLIDLGERIGHALWWLRFLPFVGPTIGEATDFAGKALGPAATATAEGLARGQLAAGFRGTRGDRNKNRGNIKMGPEARAFGAVGQDEQGHAIFPTWEAGDAALQALLRRKYSGMTIPQINAAGYAEDPNWAAGVMKYGGFGPNEIPNMNDPTVMDRLLGAISRQEGTHPPARTGITSRPLPLLGAPAAALQHSSSLYDNRSNSTRTVHVETGDLHFHDVRDAKGAASGFDRELQRQISIASIADTGLS